MNSIGLWKALPREKRNKTEFEAVVGKEMQFENEGISLWYGTPDAPAPGAVVVKASEVDVTVGVKPIDASNVVEVTYRVNGGPERRASALWLSNDPITKTQYFQAQLGPFQPGENVVYAVACACAGRRVPAKNGPNVPTSSFRVVQSEVDESSPREATARPPGRPSRASSTGSYSSLGLDPDRLIKEWGLLGVPLASAVRMWSVANGASAWPAVDGSSVGPVGRAAELLLAPYSYAAEWWKAASAAYLDLFLRR